MEQYKSNQRSKPSTSNTWFMIIPPFYFQLLIAYKQFFMNKEEVRLFYY
jgi:hypothetical protein